MASPTTTTSPASIASSPAPLAPAPIATAASQRQQSISIKPTAPPAPNSPLPITPSSSVTSKEWVVPPRPKPGRKPATDTPPTKRKAQNRAAQRAFRERRAARVGELEEHIKAIEEEDEREQVSLRHQISELNADLEDYRKQMNLWMERSSSLEKELAEERVRRDAMQRELDTLHSSGTLLAASAGGEATSLTDAQADTLIGCGGCSTTSRCQCVESALELPQAAGVDSSASKRPHSPLPARAEKRVKSEVVDEAMEVDYTHAFSRQEKTQNVISSPRVVADPCGFCQDGTPCICAEMASENHPTEERVNDIRSTAQIPSLRQLSQFTPPPSDGDVALPPQAPPVTMSSDSCVNGAGTCAQCQADPKSTLFCKTLAAARARSMGSNTPAGCCGGSRNGQSCCQSQSRTLPPPLSRTRRQADLHSNSGRQEQSPSASITLSCADAYTTLSRHPGYERAITSGDLGSWMPKLYASPSRDVNGDNHSKGQVIETRARPAMEIEVANVMSVLREFDRRFGSNT